MRLSGKYNVEGDFLVGAESVIVSGRFGSLVSEGYNRSRSFTRANKIETSVEMSVQTIDDV
jgi:hypothetical protein